MRKKIMLDITKNRSSYQNIPINKQKCKPIGLVPNTKHNTSYTTKAAAATSVQHTATKVAVAASAATTTTTSATITKTTSKSQATKLSVISNSQKLYTTATTTKTTTTTTATIKANRVRVANQQFFLTNAYKDQNFLKKECEVAHAQLDVANAASPKNKAHCLLEDKRNNNNNNNSINNTLQCISYNKHHNRKSSPSTKLPHITNGMRQSGQNSCLGNISRQLQSQPTATATSTPSSIQQQKNLNTTVQYKVKTFPLNTAVAASPYTTNKLNGSQRQTTVRPLVHRTIPAATVAAVNVIPTNNINNNNNNNNTNNNSASSELNQQNNNNMEHIYNRVALEPDADDIKYIDSDEVAAGSAGAVCGTRKTANACCQSTTTPATTTNATSRSRVRPKSTIICSATNLVFEKMNNFKMSAANNTSTATRHGIDSNSIKASIEKFNNFSEQKRLPLSVTLRSHAGSSGNNLQTQQHRHSSDFENCNTRLSAGGSLTRAPYRMLPSGTTISAITHNSATPTSKVITSMHATASAARAAALSNSLPTKSSSASMRSQQETQQQRGSTSSLQMKNFPTPANTTRMYKITIIKQPNEVGEEQSKSLITTAGGAVITPIGVPLEETGHKKKVIISGSGGALSEADVDSVRSSTMRIPSAPLTTSASRYCDRGSNRNSTYSTSSAYLSNNGDTDNSSSNNAVNTENQEGEH